MRLATLCRFYFPIECVVLSYPYRTCLSTGTWVNSIDWPTGMSQFWWLRQVSQRTSWRLAQRFLVRNWRCSACLRGCWTVKKVLFRSLLSRYCEGLPSFSRFLLTEPPSLFGFLVVLCFIRAVDDTVWSLLHTKNTWSVRKHTVVTYPFSEDRCWNWFSVFSFFQYVWTRDEKTCCNFTKCAT